MATAASSSSSSSDEELPTETTKEQNNRSRLQPYIELGTKALLNKFHDNDTFSFSRDPKQLYLELKQKKSQIENLRKKMFCLKTNMSCYYHLQVIQFILTLLI